MQITDVDPQAQDRMAFARAVRRRDADHRMASELIDRGWTCVPPDDEIERVISERVK
jgi:hypothetical protein